VIDGRDIISDREWARQQSIQAVASIAVTELQCLWNEPAVPDVVKVSTEKALRRCREAAGHDPGSYFEARLKVTLGESP
jgi:hypothetical protein